MSHTIKWIPAVIMMGLAACNSGSSTTSGTDSTAATKDTSMQGMKTAGIDSLPAVPAGARVYFKNLKDGQTVTSPLKLEFGVEGIALDSAGKVLAGSGHHHLLIDAGDSIPSGQVVPKDSTHVHFGKAQSEYTVILPPGKHTLALQYADGAHRSYGSQLSAAITVIVKK
jgi:hypothetical protein